MKKRLPILFLAISLIMSFATISFSNLTDKSNLQPKWNSSKGTPSGKFIAKYVPNEVIVEFKGDVSEAMKMQVRDMVQATKKDTLVSKEWAAEVYRSNPNLDENARLNLDFGDVELFSVNGDIDVMATVDALKAHPFVKYAEPNWIYTHTATSNDPLYTGGNLYGMYGDQTTPANQFGSQAGEAWAAGNVGSRTVYIGVIDEGMMVTHEDLAANVWNNPFDPVDGVDNDGNGYVDDRNGWDFDGNNNSVYDGSTDDHGTHVAGTIGAVGGNGKGVAGVSWNVTLISTKFLGRNGGTTANAIKAIDYMTDLKTRHGLNVVATNNSWGGGGFSQALRDSIERANVANILFVAAAGNGGGDGVGDNNDTTPHYPSSYDNTNIIAVASITSSGARSSFSNFGATSVDIGAPGSSINSTLPTRQNKSTYGAYSGTSMATPHVAGGVALYAATHPGASAATIRNAILSSAVPTSSLTGICVTGGRLNVSGF
ncbi:MAG: S8 family peptidase [Blastocatellia bacterium]